MYPCQNTIIKKTHNKFLWRYDEKKPTYALSGNVNKCHSYGNLYDGSLKNQQQQNLAIALSNDPAKPLLSIDLKECKSA
jgi:hypothetical protein